jgi:hypothetical protein
VCTRGSNRALLGGPSTPPLDASVECRTSIPRTLGWLGLAVLMIAASYYTGRTATGFIRAVGWLAVVFCGVCLVPIILQLFRRGPTIVIDEDGVLDRRLHVGRISWQDIASVSIVQSGRQRLISLWLRNPEHYLSPAPTWSAGLSRVGEEMGYSPFSLNFAGLTPGLEETYAYLRTRLPERAGV